MKIEYKFVDGTMAEIEVDGSLGEFMLELKKEGDRVERKETRRHMSLDGMDFEGDLFVSAGDTEGTAIFRDDMGRLAQALDRLSPEQRELVKESYAELSGGEVTATNILTRLLRLSQLTGGFIGNDETAAVEQVNCAKLSALEDILDGIMAEGKKLVIIARFVPEIKAICRLLEKRKLRYSCIAGGVKDREGQVAAFQNEPEVMAFVGQIATAGLGITLTAASTMVFYSLDYSMSNFEQAKARIHRGGRRSCLLHSRARNLATLCMRR